MYPKLGILVSLEVHLLQYTLAFTDSTRGHKIFYAISAVMLSSEQTKALVAFVASLHFVFCEQSIRDRRTIKVIVETCDFCLTNRLPKGV